MNTLISIVCIGLGFVLLTKGADEFVENASGLASKLHVSPLIIGLTIVAFGTSLPEFAVSLSASIEGSNEIALGNVVGSNIFNLLVVAGASAIFHPLICDKAILKRDWPISIGAACILAVLLWDGVISRFDGFILMICFIISLILQFKSSTSNQIETQTKSYSHYIVFLIIGMACILIGSQLTVNGAKSLASLLGLSESFIGLTIVAIGTSLPELVTSVVATKKGEHEIALGNVIGSNIFNILCILGVSSFVNPIIVNNAMIDVVVLIGISVLYWFIAKYYKLNKMIGLSMVGIYILYTIFLFVR
ncbi:MAG: calcium/sodium antiporter [Erysipelotrichaceae bacterium]|uniref:calcium/sodium antiporter n=1 Tax=Floccifex sp. TaxID=2815810 RepID=UPI002A7608F7|nr:calcium/sodium antiporter [Floccifex sp.]MDD7280453.1 calcium/sodium antiporter [Erysipelotrichaceae bacterium]MDY2958829.1 calcium/sodium antiporter [Floccifex sp.]